MQNIIIKGAKVHNLKNIDISIPKNKLIIVTGVSGSGKSSLVFDILFEEGRRQYLQSLGMLAEIIEEDKFESIFGLGPTIAVQQNIIRQSNPRSTVGSKTNILNLLGILYACESRMQCRTCNIMLDNNLKCNTCGDTEERLSADYFSYRSPNGMCLKCSGKGAYFQINLAKLVPNENTTLQQVFDTVGATPGYSNLLHNKFHEFLTTPFSQIPDEIKQEILYGHYVQNNAAQTSVCLTRIFQGGLIKDEKDISDLYSIVKCTECQGFRIGEDARRFFLNGKHIGELGLMTISELHRFLEHLPDQTNFTSFGQNILKEINLKIQNLIRFHLNHLTLYREVPSLSGGELQRLFLNMHLDSKMDSLIYILDEPTIGLHDSEKAEILNAIKDIKDLGNTVIIVEHDRKSIEMAEHVIEIGPKAGIEGGQLIYQGDLAGLLRCPNSLTGQYLSGNKNLPLRPNKEINKNFCLTIRHAKTNNLKDITVSFPLETLVGIAGVSGSGKSSLISETLIPLVQNYFHSKRENNKNANESDAFNEAENPEDVEINLIETIADKLEGLENLTGYVEVSQAPIGRHLNSNPITYLGIWDKIRKLFAQQSEAIQQNLTAGHFSFNSKGACSGCGGTGKEKTWLGGNMFFYKTCKECHGKRFSSDALSVRYKGRTIFDVLEMRVSEAVTFFEEIKSITSVLKILERIGMGYIGLGQPTPTLSGGEAQRIKLAKEIGKVRKGNILYVLDEPTTGLSIYDTAKLIQLLDELVAKGNSVVVVEHDSSVLSVCDWIIELGPGSGAEGGQLIAEGKPQDLIANPRSKTGQYLAKNSFQIGGKQ